MHVNVQYLKDFWQCFIIIIITMKQLLQSMKLRLRSQYFACAALCPEVHIN